MKTCLCRSRLGTCRGSCHDFSMFAIGYRKTKLSEERQRDR